MNPILNADSYKLSHFLQYPKDMKYASSYVESRGGGRGKVLFYGLQAFLMKYLSQKITGDDILEAKDFASRHGEPFNEKGWRHILDAHGGALPLQIEAVAEGTLVDTGSVLVQLRNTDPACFWLPQYVETALLRGIWYPTTVATNSFFYKQTILKYLSETGDPRTVDFRLHDFGARGVSSFESAGLGGSAHLINFKGTDTISGALFAREFYGADIAGFSIPAAEHSTITAWGVENESAAYENMAARFGSGTFACVIDSYDALNAIGIWTDLFDRVKEKGGTVVLRPDSGNPVTMAAASLERMMEIAGYSVNELGYKVLPNHIRLIYGDGIDEKTLGAVLEELKERKISADNISFGMGGALLQHLNRDTLRFAMKLNAVSNDGENWVGVSKNPNSDPSKHSKSGRLALVKREGKYQSVPLGELGGRQNKLRTVFLNGEIVEKTTFEEIRVRAAEASIQI